jgi:hypothetical protein
MFASHWNWLLSIFSHLLKSRPVKVVARRRPLLELLEDRLVPSGTSVISGFALLDQTGNGQSADDTGLRHVPVLLYQDSNHDGTLDRGDKLVDVTHTASNGAFSFDHLKAGTYFVAELTPFGYVHTAPTAGSYYTVTLGANQVASGNVFDNFRTLNTGLIGNVSYTIQDPTLGTYTVKDLRGQTHAGDTITVNFTVYGHASQVVSLAVYSAPGATFDPNTASQQQLIADATGTFTPGKHSLTVTLPTSGFYQVDFVDGAAIDHFGPAGSHVFYSAQHRLFSADNGGSPVVQPPVTQPPQTATFSGVVFDDTDNNDGIFQSGIESGLQGSVVTINGTDASNASFVAQTTTDGSGFFQFTGLAPGSYHVTFSNANSTVNGQLTPTSADPSAIPSGVTQNFAGDFNFTITAGGNLVLNEPEGIPIRVK